MQTSIFLARLIGPVFLAGAIAMLLNRDSFKALAEDVLSNRGLLFLTGMLTMIAGLAIVLNHNIWAADWRVLVTIGGWLSLIGGAARMIVPDLVIRTGRTMLRQKNTMLIGAGIWAAIGLVLCFYGYVR